MKKLMTLIASIWTGLNIDFIKLFNSIGVVLAGALVLTIVLIIMLSRRYRKLETQNKENVNHNTLRQTFIDAVDDFIYLKDENLKYVFVNKKFEELFDKPQTEIIGKRDAELTDNELIKACQVTDLSVQKEKLVISESIKSGDKIYQSKKFPVRFLNGKYGVGGFIEDITEKYHNERKSRKALERNIILVDILSRKYDSIEEQFNYALKEIIRLTESLYGYIFRYSEEDKEFTLQSWSEGVMAECAVIERLTKYQLSKMGLWGEVVRQRKPIIINDFQSSNPLKKGYPEGHVPLTRFMSVPIFIEDRIVACVGLANKNEDYDDDDIYHVTALIHGVWNNKERQEAVLQMQKYNEEVKHLSFHDALTGLYNRRFFEEELKRLDTPRNLPLSIVMGDVDGLKLTNDIFGHEAGDMLIKTAAQIMKKCCRADDIIARWGGDEYIILLPKTTTEEAESIAQRIKKSLADVKIHAIKGSISMGCGTKYSAEEDVQRAIETADEKMYLEKTLSSKNFNSQAIKEILDTLFTILPGAEAHLRRVSELSGKIGEKLGLSEHTLNKLKNAAMLHDIGLISIDKNILKKKSGFSCYELEKIRQCPVIGFRILHSNADTIELADYVFCHQERWDGAGYPKGLKGEDIPLLSRIIALAEKYDQLLTGFMCNEKLSGPEAVNFIQNNSGTLFDPKVVNAFLDIIPQFSFDTSAL